MTSPHAIVQLTSTRPTLLTFEVRGKIAKADMERMAETVDNAIDDLGEIDILLIFTSYDGATLPATFDPKAIKVSLRSNAHVRRYAVVGAPLVANAMINLFDPISPVDAKTFDLDNLADAKAWIDEPSK